MAVSLEGGRRRRLRGRSRSSGDSREHPEPRPCCKELSSKVAEEEHMTVA